jgi:hypothetical protein
MRHANQYANAAAMQGQGVDGSQNESKTKYNLCLPNHVECYIDDQIIKTICF